MPKPKLIQGNELFNLYKKKINHEKKVINNLIKPKPEHKLNINEDYTIPEEMKIKIKKLIKLK